MWKWKQKEHRFLSDHIMQVRRKRTSVRVFHGVLILYFLNVPFLSLYIKCLFWRGSMCELLQVSCIKQIHII